MLNSNRSCPQKAQLLRRRWYKGIIVFAALWSCLMDHQVQSATVMTKDGREIKGTVVGATARDVQLHTDKGTQTIEAEQILRIDYSDESQPAIQPPPADRTPPEAYPPRRTRRSAENVEDLRQVFVFDLGIGSPASRISAGASGGTSARNGASGFRAGVEYLYFITPRFGAGIDFHYWHRSQLDNTGLIPFGVSRISGDTIMPLLVGKYVLTGRGYARPYLLAGAGVNRTSMSIDTDPLFGFSWSDTGTAETRSLVDDERWGFASRVALGIDFFATEPAIFSFEAGWLGIANRRYQSTPAGRDLGLDNPTGNLNAVTIALRWGWRF